MSSTEFRIQIWRHNLAPPINKPFLHNAFVVLEIQNIAIGGEVRWDLHLQQYVFQPAEVTSETTYKLYEITISPHHYVLFRQIIRDQLGVYVTRGIYDGSCPPRTLAEQLPASLGIIKV